MKKLYNIVVCMGDKVLASLERQTAREADGIIMAAHVFAEIFQEPVTISVQEITEH